MARSDCVSDAGHYIFSVNSLTSRELRALSGKDDYMLPATMIAIDITAPGGPEVLRAGERPVPRPGPAQVLIKVAYAGVQSVEVDGGAGVNT